MTRNIVLADYGPRMALAILRRCSAALWGAALDVEE